uniref:DDE Tnp4 domain-containing protein n=1 Tax=Ditylenchus dipsaci TaxID=166011 RepID=A0A915EN55_9BILA
MENFQLEEAIGWWALRKKRSYVRPAHYKSALHRNSFAIFWRYYSSSDQAFGPTYSAVAPLFVIGDSTVHDICKEVSEAIVTAMQTEYLPTPTCQTWERSAEGFNRLRQFPKNLGAIEGKHIAIVKPEHSGAAFFNYKKFYWIVLLAITDAESRFLMVDVDASGRNSDSTLWISSPSRNYLESPEAALPPNEEGSLPFIFLGTVDSDTQIWPETARLYTLAAVILHNFLRGPVEEEDLNLRFPKLLSYSNKSKMEVTRECSWSAKVILILFFNFAH